MMRLVLLFPNLLKLFFPNPNVPHDTLTNPDVAHAQPSCALLQTRINSAGALLAFRKRFGAFPQNIRRPSVTRTSSR